MPSSNQRPKKSLLGHLFRIVLLLVALAVVVAVVIIGWTYSHVRASLPQLDGDASLAGLSSEVVVTRDALGVPTIRAGNRADIARALGFLHGQERFFQMDLSRRRAAGELAELIGPKAIEEDKAIRIHGLRNVAKQALALLSAEERTLLDCYTEGVNTGLKQLGAQPFEYLLLRVNPRPWSPEDCLLVIHAMAISLQNPTGVYERSLGLVNDKLGQEVMDYFVPRVAPDDSALDGSTAPLPPMPGPHFLNLRADKTAQIDSELSSTTATLAFGADPIAAAMPWLGEGSNSMALAGSRTATGVGMVENDMHLSLRVPNTWYRASLSWPAQECLSGVITLTGVTMPGTPAVIAGSNGHVAWGFTTSYADTSDLVVLTRPSGSSDADEYLAPDGTAHRIQSRQETILVREQKDPVTISIPCSIWGPVVGEDSKGQKLSLKWVFHEPAAANFRLLGFETARTMPEVIALAHHTGIPAQNLVVADTTGAIGWTICGRLPSRIGFDGRLPVSWATGANRWDGFVPPDKMPTYLNPTSGRLYTANQRLMGGKWLEVIGDGAPRPGQRGTLIRRDMELIEKNAIPADLLTVALGDRASHLDRWHGLFMGTLSPDAIAQKPTRGDLRIATEKWDARATVDSTSYTIVSKFRERVTARIIRAVFASCFKEYPDFNYKRFHCEEAVWQIVHEQPEHLLPRAFKTWDELLLAAADDVERELAKDKLTPATARWGILNTAKIRHPLSSALPGFLASYLDMPADELPGDDDVPRVQRPSNGASERFIVSPGHEADGIYHMPGGQSGHLLSPYYKAGHEAWVKGEPTPFLPGPTVHTLVLRPNLQQ